MDELLQDIEAEKEKIGGTLNALEKTLHRKRRTFIELAAIATCLHNTYSGIARFGIFLCMAMASF